MSSKSIQRRVVEIIWGNGEIVSRSLSIRGSTRSQCFPPTQAKPRRRPKTSPLGRRNVRRTAEGGRVWVELESETEKTLTFTEFSEDVGGGDARGLDVLPDLEKGGGQCVELKGTRGEV